MPRLKNPQRERFAREYLKDLNSTQAYTRAGYPSTNPNVNGPRLLQEPEVAARVQELIEERERRLEVNADFVVDELAKIARADPRKLFNEDGSMKGIHELDDETVAAISAFEVVAGKSAAIKRWDRVKVLELLGRHFGMWPTKIQADIDLMGRLNADERRAVLEVLDAIARDKGEDAPGASGTKH